tara:strand:+ start:213 stop:419 length:207 start_codon:yes stop_codon:yes gene_type:complete
MKKLTLEEKTIIREMLIEDNKRIEHDRFMGNSVQAVNAKRAKHLRPSRLALLYNVSVSQVKTAAKDLI